MTSSPATENPVDAAPAATALATKSRRALHAYVSDEAHDSWHDFAAVNGVTVSGLLEALAPLMAGDRGQLDVEAAIADAIRVARTVDARRRRRS